MKLAAATAAIAVAVAVSPAAAQDDLPDPQRTVPRPYVPTKAKRVTVPIAHALTEAEATKEMADTTVWPAGHTFDTVYNCTTTSKRRGRCDYRLYYVDDETGTHMTYCERRVVVTSAKRTHRLRSKVREFDCGRT